MTSTTNSKKEIIDFLWEWAEARGTWGKLLVESIVKTENVLTTQERSLVFDYFIDSLRKAPTLPILNIVKPIFLATSKTITLSSLSDITGVNRLAKNQTMNFSDNITIIYGENGTGKTGYGRILKCLGFSYDMHNIIHNNIFGKAEAKSAKIDFKIDSDSKSFTWTGTNSHPALSNISVFNNNCVQISLADRKLIVSPIGFHLFTIATSELGELSKLLQSKISSYSVTLLCAGSFTEGTPQHSFINTLNEKSTDQKLIELATIPPDIDLLIQQKENAKGGLNKELLNTQIANINSQVIELDSIISKIEFASANFTNTEWQSLISLNEKISSLEGKTKGGLKEIAEISGIELYESDEFKHFIVAAERYINLLEKPYPEAGDLCIYCKQPLEESAQKMLKAYRKLLNDTTAHDLKIFTDERLEIIAKVHLVESKIVFNYGVFGIDEHGKAIQPKELLAYNEKLTALKDLFTGKLTTAHIFDLKYDGLVGIFKSKVTELKDSLLAKNESLMSISEKANKLQSEINELKDRKTLDANLQAIRTVIANKKTISLLSSKINDFSTNSISRKTSEAREELLSQNFNDMFQDELKAFRKGHLKIDLSFGTDRGSSKISQRINQYSLTDILSEGEQKAIALAEFLTELHLDNIKAPVVFDDPVNSLDHNNTDEVSKRLIELSRSRQVIVFTHDILLLNSFLQQRDLDTTKQAGINLIFHSVKNNFDDTGILDIVDGINSYSYYVSELKKAINWVDKSLNEEKLAKEGYGHLRSAIEKCVEAELLKDTIKRYRKGVAFPALLRIEGAKIDLFKGALNTIYEKCCVSITGHSSPEQIHVTPTLIGLKADFDQFEKLRSSFK